jgi:hypothetical protein
MEGIEIIESRPGQLSLAIDRVRGNDILARELESRFAVISGIRQVEVDPGQGTVSIAYNQQQLFSLGSLLHLKAAFSSCFPEIDVFQLATWLNRNI